MSLSSLYSEYIAGESNDKFWEFVDGVSALTPEQVQSGLYSETQFYQLEMIHVYINDFETFPL